MIITINIVEDEREYSYFISSYDLTNYFYLKRISCAVHGSASSVSRTETTNL